MKYCKHNSNICNCKNIISENITSLNITSQNNTLENNILENNILENNINSFICQHNSFICNCNNITSKNNTLENNNLENNNLENNKLENNTNNINSFICQHNSFICNCNNITSKNNTLENNNLENNNLENNKLENNTNNINSFICQHNSFICNCNNITSKNNNLENNILENNTFENNILENNTFENNTNNINSFICQHNSFLCKCKYNLLNENELKIAIVGTGFVGSAIINSLKIKNILNIIPYDKYLNGGIGKINDILNAHIIILTLPTPFSEINNNYDLNPIIETLNFLHINNFTNPIIIKSTILPETTNNLSSQFKSLNLIHNPEFLTQKTAFEDFHNQSHIVLGKSNNCSSFSFNFVIQFYKKYYPNAIISECTSNESESMKIFCNSFYSVKIQFFNELFALCNKNNTSFNNVKNLMLKNGWINPMHTNVPGNDGKLSYGGYCFPKDTNALLSYMKEKNSEHKILDACIKERNELRSDNINIIKQNY